MPSVAENGDDPRDHEPERDRKPSAQRMANGIEVGRKIFIWIGLYPLKEPNSDE